MRDFERAIGSRDKFKAEAAELRSRLGQYETRDAVAQQQQRDTELETLRAFKTERTTADEAQARLDKRGKVRDLILEGAHPDHKDTLRLMLTGLHDEGEINLDHDNPATAGAEAHEKLSKRYPAYFQAPDGVEQAGQPGHPGIDLTGVEFPTQLTAEQQAKLTPEQWDAVFMPKVEIDTGA